MIRLGLDVMGGDYAPDAILEGAFAALKELPDDVTLVLVGNESAIEDYLKRCSSRPENIEIIHSPETIGMGDHPTKAFSKKPQSSIVIGFRLLEEGKIDAFASAGNTGAMLVGTTMTIRTIPGIIRPTIAATIPNMHTGQTILLDVGLTPDAKPDVMYQYGILGSLYARHVFNIKEPRVALLNIGTEPSKGNLAARSAFEMMKDSRDFNFVGNIEGNNLFISDTADVIVCDGFVGNIVLKEGEALYSIAKTRGIRDDFLEKFNFEKYGGTPILGVNGNVIIAHGISNEKAIRTMLLHTLEIVKAGLTQKIIKAFEY